jgi:aminopeptidase N
VRGYIDAKRDDFASTEDFVRAMFDATGRNVAGHVQTWVEGGGHPILAVSFDLERARRGEGPLELRVRQVQALDELVPLFDVQVEVELVCAAADGMRSHSTTLHVGQREEVFELDLDGPLEDLVFDAGCEILCELELEKDCAMWVRQSRAQRAAQRWRALDPLAALAQHDDAAAEALRACLAHDTQPIVRAKAARRCTFPAARPALIDALERDPDAIVRRACADTLARQDPTRAEETRLLAHYAHERSPATRRALERQLGLIDVAEPARR